MRHTFIILLLAASTMAASAQTAAKSATAAKPVAKPATAAAKPPTAVVKSAPTADKLPAGIPAVTGVHKTLFSLTYQEIKIGTGAEAEQNKMYKVHYTGWLAADGHKFDSSYDHLQPVLDKDGKPVLGNDGKPKEGEAQPISFPQGFGRVIPGWDQGFEGMKIGGQRRIFIPWQLAYGAKGRPGPDPAHPVIPEKADLIFDIELVDVTEMPQPPNRTGMTPGAHPMPGPARTPAAAAAAQPGATPKPTAPAAAPAPAAPATPAAPQPK